MTVGGYNKWEGHGMRRIIRFGMAKAVFVFVLALLGLGGIPILGQASAGASTQPPGLDHFLCYSATVPAGTVTFNPPAGVMLANQFSKGFAPKIGAVQLHCNPTQKTITTTTPPTVYPITNPNAHLVCFGIAGARQPSVTVLVTNQFGKGELVATSPTKLCLPSWKSLQGPPNMRPNQPPGLDHFTCYPVTHATTGPHFNPPASVVVQDQFARAGVTVKVGAPKLLCLPTQKTLATGQVYKITNPRAHLLCFAVTPTPVISPVFDQNQFGTSPVTIEVTKLLCLPSYKSVVVPPTSR